MSGLVPLRAFDLAEVLPSLPWPGALASPAGLADAVGRAGGLPPVFHWAMLEVRLTGDDSKVDLLTSVVDMPGARERLRDGPEITPLLGAWARRDVPELDDVHVVWLEWDSPFEPDQAPLQILSIEPSFWGPRSAGPASPDRQVAVTSAAHAAALGVGLRPGVARTLARLLRALPRGGRAIAVASLAPRGRDVLRLFVGLPVARVDPWLEAIGWPGDRAAVSEWLPRVVMPWETAFLQVELADDVGRYLGIEPRQTASAVELRDRGAFLVGLAADGLTSMEKAKAVTAWDGRRDVRSAEGTVQEVRSFHLKTVVEDSGPPVVKAYLGFHYEA